MGKRTHTTALVIFGACAAFAQGPLTFEVASIRPSTAEERPAFSIGPGGTIQVTAWSVKPMIQNAFDIPGFFVFGAPNWSNFDKYDIVAKADDSSSPPAGHPANFDDNRAYQSRMMLRFRALLADRFHLQTHSEIKELNGYALVIAKNGSKLRESKPGDPGLDTFNAPDGSKGQAIRGGPSRYRGGTKFTAQRATMTMIASMLTRSLGMPVADKSGLTGEYDFVLEWAPESSDSAADQGAPTLSTVLQEQLGLRLESAKVPVETMVIDRLEKPSDN